MNDTPDQAHELAGPPVCPRCGRLAMYEGSPDDTKGVDRAYPVRCVWTECGWRGVHVRVRTVR